MRKHLGIVLSVVGVLLVGLGFVFCTNFFIPNSEIETDLGEIPVGFRQKGFLISEMENQANAYTLCVVDNASNTHTVKLANFCDINTDEIEEIVNSKSYIDWHKDGYIETASYCSANMEKVQEQLDEIRPEETILSEPAEIFFNHTTSKYEIKPEVYGNEYTTNCAVLFANALLKGMKQLNLNELGCYILPSVCKDNPELVKKASDMNEYLGTEITLYSGESSIKIDNTIYKDWLSFKDTDGSFSVILDEEKLREYSNKLASDFSTVDSKRDFSTSVGTVVELNNGDYGWIVDKDFVFEVLKDGILNKKSGTYELKFSQTARKSGFDDVGDTYVEVSIENQKLWMYVDGELLIETNIVTGNEKLGHNTRKGVFYMKYKTKNVTLRGQGYASPVSYWMPFDGGIGLHDATWRSSFGGSIYKTNGSHGCVNMPFSAAKTVYANIDSTMPIIVW